MSAKYQTQSIGRDRAIKLAKSQWWVDESPESIARFQLFTDELCMPFDVFHESIEKALGGPVFTHEFGMNSDGLRGELLKQSPAPTFDEIINLIPSEKRVLIQIP
jgi:hypothetical protein